VKNLLNEALKVALRLITKRDRTEAELIEKLKKKQFPEEIINETVDYLKQRGFIDDSRFIHRADKIAEDRFIGKKGLQNYLMRKGIDKELLQNLPELDELSIAKKLLKRKKHLIKDAPADRKRAKIAGFLLRRGFSWDTVNKCLKLDDKEV